ncbi:MAG TPA: Trm112 family protein [Rhodanobacteraceae bacterium]|nr:Trm112 family protein [Rhodanobacteraceae bacterium]
MDKHLLDILVCPLSHVPLRQLTAAELKSLNDAIAHGGIGNAGGDTLTGRLNAALITTDQARIYPVEDDIPVLLAEAAIDAAQLADQPVA